MNDDENIEILNPDEADNESESITLTEDSTDAGTENQKVDEPIDKTKAFSDRLKKKTEEIEKKYEKMYQDKLDSQAKVHGYKNWAEYQDAINKNALLDAGVEDVDKFQDVLKEMISQNPDVIEAKEIVEKNKQMEMERTVQSDIAKIKQYDASINSLDDISKLDNCQEIINKINSGYSLFDAYVLANLDTIKNNVKEAGKTSAINNIDSKSHMKTATGGTTSDIVVPDDVLQMYRKNLKGWTDKQIKEHYAKLNK